MNVCFFCEDFFSKCESLFRPDLAEKPVVVVSKAKNPLCRRKILSANTIARAMGLCAGIFLPDDSSLPESVCLFYENPALYGDIARRMLYVCRRFSRAVSTDGGGNITVCFDDSRTGDFSSFSARIASCIRRETGIDVQVRLMCAAAPVVTATKPPSGKNSRAPKNTCLPIGPSAGRFRVKYSPGYTTDTAALPAVK